MIKLFRKKTRHTAGSLSEFWQWWAGARDEVAAAIEAGTVEASGERLGRRVEAIHADLQWELTPGGTSAHTLVVSAGGRPEIRAVAARWLAAAPPADATWSYRDVRAADPAAFEAVIQMNGHELDLAEIRYGIAVDRERRQIDVVCHHPGFAGLPDDVRGQITFLSLDWAVGEDDVEVWLGEVGWSDVAPANPRTPADLRHAVDAVATGEDTWVLMEGERLGAPLLATVASPLRGARWPRFDLHVAVRLPYRRHNDGLLPVDESLQALRDFEDEVCAAVGTNGTLVAHETSGRLRILHFYADAQSNARAEIESRLPQWREGRASADVRVDPGFEQVRHLMS